jgi:hypothetical protein
MRRFSTSICSDPIPQTHSRRGTTSNCSRCLSTRCRRSPKRIFFCLTCDQLCRYQSHRNGGALQKHQQDLMGLCTNRVLTSNSIHLSFAPSRLPFILGVNLPFQTISDTYKGKDGSTIIGLDTWAPPEMLHKLRVLRLAEEGRHRSKKMSKK